MVWKRTGDATPQNSPRTRPQKKKIRPLTSRTGSPSPGRGIPAAQVGTHTLPGSVAPANRPAGGLAGRGFARSGNGGQKAARECLDTCVPSGSCGAAACRKAWFGCGSTISSPTSALQSTAAFTTGPVRPALASALTRHHSAYASLPMPDAKQTTVLPGAVHAAGASGGPVSAVDTGVPATCHDDAFHSDTACRDGPGFPPLHLETWVNKP